MSTIAITPKSSSVWVVSRRQPSVSASNGAVMNVFHSTVNAFLPDLEPGAIGMREMTLSAEEAEGIRRLIDQPQRRQTIPPREMPSEDASFLLTRR